MAAYAAAAVAGFEAIVVLASAGREAGVVAPAVTAAASAEIAVAALAGALVAVRSLRRAPSRAIVATLSCAVTLASCGLFILANDIVAAVPNRHALAPWAAAVVLAAGPLAYLLRQLGWHPLVDPPVAGACLAAGFGAHRLAHVGAAWSMAVALVGAIAAGVVLRLAARRARPFAHAPLGWRAAAWIPLAVPALLAAFSIAASRPPPAPAPLSGGRPDVLLVVLDTVRADAAPAGPDAPLPTPAIARLAAEGTRYTAAFSTSCWTLPAHASLFTGLTTGEHRTGWESPYLPDDFEALAETLSREGYRTAGFSANVWISPEFGFDQGFDRFVTVSASDRPLTPWPVRLAPGAFASWDATLPFDDKGGATLSLEALRFLGARDRRPAFVFLNLLEAHMPYAPPERFLRRIEGGGFTHDALLDIPQQPLQGLVPGNQPSPRELAGLKRLYGAEVAYDDALLGRMIERLRAASRLENTVVIVAGDHGENLGDHPPLDHQLGLWDSLVHVPLVVRYPSRLSPPSEVGDLVSLADVRGAILDLTGVTRSGEPGPMLARPPRDAVFIGYDRPGEILDRIRDDGIDPTPWDRRLDAIRTPTAKWIVGSDGSRSAFDLTIDPAEREDLAAKAVGVPAGFARLAGKLDEHVAAMVASPVRSNPPISDEARRQLRSLGYVK